MPSSRRGLAAVVLCSPLLAPSGARAFDWPADAFLHDRVAALLQHVVHDARRVALPEGAVELDPETYRFYGDRDHRPAWVHGGDIGPTAREFALALQEAAGHGLPSAEYHLESIGRRMGGANDALRLAQLDALLTDAYIRYTRDLSQGRIDPRRLGTDWFIYPERASPARRLTDALVSGEAVLSVDSAGPTQVGYQRLRKALARYRRTEASGGWPRVPAGAQLLPGVEDARVPLLRRRLYVTGDLPAGTALDDRRFDDVLGRAVRKFQARHGLSDDGWVGQGTLDALNVPASTRVRQILLNLERWRWLPRDTGSRYLMVNMAGFELTAVEDGRTVLTMPVIVGRDHRQTPALQSRVTSVVLNPYWFVPPTVFREDLLPRLRKDPRYLDRAGIAVLSSLEGHGTLVDPATIDWNRVDPDRFPFTLRQGPGVGNALGRIKFMLPNDFGIYLHDTPNRDLFTSRVRTFSSGCIRVRDPVDLASYVMRGQRGWERRRIADSITEGTPRKVTLERPVPIFLVYMTAWVDDGGTVQFREDVYGRDRRLADALLPAPMTVPGLH